MFFLHILITPGSASLGFVDAISLRQILQSNNRKIFPLTSSSAQRGGRELVWGRWALVWVWPVCLPPPPISTPPYVVAQASCISTLVQLPVTESDLLSFS